MLLDRPDDLLSGDGSRNISKENSQKTRSRAIYADAGVTIDHIFSISAAILGGMIWNVYGFQYVFLFGALLAAINFFVAGRVRVPDAELETQGI